MIKLTLTIEDLKNGCARVGVNSAPTGKPTGIEMAHASTIFSILGSSEYQELVKSSFIERGGACSCEKCQAERKQSEAPACPIH